MKISPRLDKMWAFSSLSPNPKPNVPTKEQGMAGLQLGRECVRAGNQRRKDTSPSLQANRCKGGRLEPGFAQQNRDLTPTVDKVSPIWFLLVLCGRENKGGT